MPWDNSDVSRFNKKLTSKKDKETWVKIANGTLASCLKSGKDNSKCEGTAIATANSHFENKEQKENMPPKKPVVIKKKTVRSPEKRPKKKTVSSKPKPSKTKKKIKKLVKSTPVPITSGREGKPRRSALDLAKEAREMEEKILAEEKKWEVPAFLRRKPEKN